MMVLSLDILVGWDETARNWQQQQNKGCSRANNDATTNLQWRQADLEQS